MHQGEINPRLENHAIKRKLGQTQKRVLFSSKMVPGDTRRGRGTDPVPLSAAQELGIIRIIEEINPWAGSWAAQSPRNTHKKILPKKPSTFNSGQYKEHLEKSVFLGEFQRSTVEVTALLKFCTCRITPAWRSHSFGACMVPPEIPAGKLLQENCQKVWAEPKTMGLAWEWLWFLQP